MKVTLAIVVVLVLSAAAAGTSRAPQQGAPVASPRPSDAAAAGAQQQETVTPSLKPCTESKNTCDAEPSPQPETSSPASNTEPKSSEAKPAVKVAAPRKKSRHHQSAKKPMPASDPAAPKKIVVRQGGTSEPAVVLTPGGTSRGAFSPQMTADLLSATDANLKEATSKPLSATQEETVNQIKLFMEQANAAVKAGDLDRGHNLAIKAHLLSDDLVKH